MKVKVNLDLIMHIPGEFQDDHLAVKLIDRVLRDQLYVGTEFEDDSFDEVLPVEQLEIRMYKVLSGRIQND